MIQKLKLVLLFVAVAGIGSAYGQVTVGSDAAPAKAALLEIKSQAADATTNVTSTKGGLGLPRVNLVSTTTLQPFIGTSDAEWNSSNQATTKAAHAGLMVYNLSTTDPFKKGVYVWDGSTWAQIGAGGGSTTAAEKYFYIPSFNIPLDAPSDDERTFNLYNEYVKQFTKAGNSTFVSSNTATTFETIPSKGTNTLYPASELDYVVTYYDTDILKDVSVTAAGELKYKVKSQITSPASFLNVVFVIK
ncbi:hypothetical protein M2459_001565 [Parabacteroides sp. PF5-5]|uniref:hypothetical protein n=1 Tax=unclassified Parabacteroides TaxID=2649774 RepID=UPI002475832F|nr:MULTISPECIES: hypothetical protein [unclassified Parabacteroides]MDH6304829.1 hypothetical protein [Parabacteroides sp. PH5-39]MDH6315557.1 hypothetical protein [Parabacteroides sp. PF5-13]MDH6319217.1 hypothetical protein [Parabacteroides sp. PH5-13]MDH6322948.1 hypothetical protein [Parabacteroides sp. PH5-8]MDH6326750.1 hypothetical protein [Parabacteroides sp. PH5-41]